MLLGTFGGGEDEATGHLVEPGVVWVFHPGDPRFSLVDAGNCAHLHAPGLRNVVFGVHVGVLGTIPPPPPWGGFVLGAGGFFLEAGVAFVAGGGAWGGAFLVVVGGGWLHPTSHRIQKPISSLSCHLLW